ncbi:hypothetical protein C0J52_01102 [Blattella germanica]|nr:hypothetical protein C0J52_01102 [Blattella germanica]
MVERQLCQTWTGGSAMVFSIRKHFQLLAEGEGRFIVPHYVFPLLSSPLFVVLAPLDTPLHIYCCDQGTVFRPLFCFADVVCPCIEYALMTLDTVPFDTSTTFATVAAEAPTRRAKMIKPLWDSVRSHILPHHLHTTTLTAEIITAAGRGRST